MGKQALVSALPQCNFCDREAQYDGRTKRGPWAHMCPVHFQEYGTGLGTGKGQELLVREASDSDDRDFDAWKEEVDSALIASVGLSSSDLPDQRYRDMFDSGASAKAVADRIVEEEMATLGW